MSMLLRRIDGRVDREQGFVLIPEIEAPFVRPILPALSSSY